VSKNIKLNIYRTVILLVVLHGYETWSVTLREEHRLTVFKNLVVRKISGAKRGEEQDTGENYILVSLITCVACHISQVITSVRMRWVKHVAHTGEKRNTFRGFGGEI
jgi:hypothetical protein